MYGNKKKDFHRFMEDNFTYKGTAKREENCASDELRIAHQKHEGAKEPLGGFRCDFNLDACLLLLDTEHNISGNIYTILKICG